MNARGETREKLSHQSPITSHQSPVTTERKPAEDARSQLAAIVESSADAIISRAHDGTILTWNKGAERLFGYTAAEVIGANVSIIAPPDLVDELRRNTASTLQGNELRSYETQRLAKDGRRVDVSISASRVQDGAGNIECIAVIFRDISERKRVEDARAQLAAIVETSDDAIVSYDPNGTVLSWNAAAQKIFGYTAAEMIGRDISVIAPPERMHESQHSAWLLQHGKPVPPFESERVARDGCLVQVQVSTSAIRDAAGNVARIAAILRDVTERKQAEEALKRLNEKLDATLQTIPDLLFDLDENGCYHEVWALDQSLLVAQRERLLGHTVSEMLPPEAAEVILDALREAARMGTSRGQNIRLLLPEGEFWFELSTARKKINPGQPQRFIMLSRDITERKRAEVERAQLAAIVESSNDAIVGRSLDRKILSWNAAAERLFGYAATEVIGQNVSLLIPPDRDEEAARNRALLAKGIAVLDLETERLTKDGRRIPVSLSQSPIRDERGTIVGVSLIFRDISERKQAEERISYLAQYDALTGLPNRRLLNDRLTLAMARDKRLGAMTALLLLDLDRFKQINETLGHGVGDEVLKAVTVRLKERLREVDTLARLSGDEFVVVLEGVTEDTQPLRVAEKIVEAMGDALVIGGEEIFITASIGVAIYPDHADSLEKLIENAELAMYQAKREGRNTLQLYAPDQDSRRAGGFSMESKLRRALERDEFVLDFQPKVNIKTGAITGAEALIRWGNPELGLVSPADFIPLAEETGLIVPIGEWVLHSACTQAAAWHRQGHPLTMAVNLSARQFHQKNLCEMVKQTLADSGLDAKCLEFEITESMIMRRPEQAIAMLQQLHDIGLTLSVDDFGTGYSSLSYLKRFPVHKLKVDQSFVRDLSQNPDDAAIVRTVIALARNLNLKTVAEGVETEQQLIFLAGLDCDEYQGYYFSRPVPAVEFLSLLQTKQPVAGDVPEASQFSARQVNAIAAALRASR